MSDNGCRPSFGKAPSGVGTVHGVGRCTGKEHTARRRWRPPCTVPAPLVGAMSKEARAQHHGLRLNEPEPKLPIASRCRALPLPLTQGRQPCADHALAQLRFWLPPKHEHQAILKVGQPVLCFSLWHTRDKVTPSPVRRQDAGHAGLASLRFDSVSTPFARMVHKWAAALSSPPRPSRPLMCWHAAKE